ncbi:MAG: glycerophosphodiester phosphodiesterase [Actinomycetes bacterium]
MNQIFVPVTVGSQTFVLAHRGASRAERENTVLAFRAAGDMGADGVELDVRLTADHQLVVHHDPRLDDGRDICMLQRSELPEHIPTLNEALDACVGMWVNVEIKNDENEPDFDSSDSIAEVVAHALVVRDESSRFLISSFRRETIDKVHNIAPQLRTAWLTSIVAPNDAQNIVDGLVRGGHSALHPWVGLLTQELIDLCHSHGIQVNTWTCDDEVRMAELVLWKVDAICTNVPDVALRVLGR